MLPLKLCSPSNLQNLDQKKLFGWMDTTQDLSENSIFSGRLSLVKLSPGGEAVVCLREKQWLCSLNVTFFGVTFWIYFYDFTTFSKQFKCPEISDYLTLTVTLILNQKIKRVHEQVYPLQLLAEQPNKTCWQ